VHNRDDEIVASRIRPLLAVDGLAAGYGGPPALEQVRFSIPPGKRVAVLGPNGGGKTTLFRVLLGELQPLAGTVSLHARLGTVPQTERARLDYPVTALDVALMGTLGRVPWWRRPGRAERRRAQEALGLVGLEELASASFGELSGGQRQRVLLARLLAGDAELAVLDEPTASMDGPTSEATFAALRWLAAERGTTSIIVSHAAGIAVPHVDRIVLLDPEGVGLLVGTPVEVVAAPRFRGLFGGVATTCEAGDG
jgi:ABC-type Mn2+/Zn2+ transport system ATPase subunit